MIKIHNLEKKFSSDFTLSIEELEINDNERVAIIGENGSGKSTLLRLISRAINPDKGEIEINCPKEKIGYSPQTPYIFKGSVEKNISIGLHGDADIAKIISGCELESLKEKRASLLSGGEKQRVCFARMLAGNYSLLMLDEPLSATDINMSTKLETTLKAYCEKNETTLLFSTHTPSHALSLATKILIMNGGRIAEYSDIEKLREPDSEFGKLFVSRWKI